LVKFKKKFYKTQKRPQTEQKNINSNQSTLNEKKTIDTTQNIDTKTIDTTQNIDTKTNSRIFFGIRYIYLAVFFALLAGLFRPIINNESFEEVFTGMLVISVGLAGTILVYNAATSEKLRVIYFSVGFGLISISLYFIYSLAGRPLL